MILAEDINTCLTTTTINGRLVTNIVIFQNTELDLKYVEKNRDEHGFAFHALLSSEPTPTRVFSDPS